jgi:anti-sigma factor RsiW
MNCEDSRIYLPAFLDDELEVADNLRMQKHLADCADCRQAQEEQLALRSALRDPSLYAHPSPDFAKRIESAVRRAAKEEARTRRSGWFESFRFESFRWIPAAALLAVVAIIGGLLIINSLRSSDQQLIANAVLAGHIRALQADHLVDVHSSDRHTVKPWFQGKLDFSPPVPDLSELGWALIGGRLDYVDGRPVAALVYQRRMHNINVFLWPNQGAAGDSIKQADAQGYQVLHWNGADMTYWVVSDLNKAELADFARALRRH